MTITSSHSSDAAAPVAPGANPAPQPALDLIFIEGLTGETIIGIHQSELHRPQPVRIDVHAGLARSRACDTDRISDTLDYGTLRERLHCLLAEHRLQLLEGLAQAIADIVIDEFGADWVRVKLVKPNKFSDVQAVGVQIERMAPPRERALRGGPMLHLIGSGMVPGG